MKSLVKINSAVIGKNEVNAVDARELHNFLGSKRKFADWITKKIKDYKFKENQDFLSFHKNVKRAKGGSVRKEYTISLDMAKELSMIEKTKIGKEARQYFIKCEKKLKQMNEPRINIKNQGPITPDIVSLLRSNIEAADLLNIEKTHAVFAANQIVALRTGVDCLSELGNPEYRIEDKNFYMIPTGIGMNIGMSAQKVNVRLEEIGLQKKVRSLRTNKHVWVLTERGKEFAIFVYRRKKNVFSEQPVTQIKWNINVLDLFKEVPELKLINPQD